MLSLRKRIRAKRGMTFIETLVAMAVAAAFLAGVLAAFIQIVKASDLAEAKLRAINNARAALELMSIDIKAARIEPSVPLQYFIGKDSPQLFGNRIDEDGDGRIDEEVADGKDNDHDWNFASDDQHADFAGYKERAEFEGIADLGDMHVDEDCKFERDSLRFRIFPDPGNPLSRDDLISFQIGTFEDEPHVLLRTITRKVSEGASAEESYPLAFNVISLNFLYWDANRTPNYWVTEWNSYKAATFPEPKIELPVSVYITISVYAGTKPFGRVTRNEPIETVTLSTIVNIEQVLKDMRRGG